MKFTDLLDYLHYSGEFYEQNIRYESIQSDLMSDWGYCIQFEELTDQGLINAQIFDDSEGWAVCLTCRYQWWVHYAEHVQICPRCGSQEIEY